MKKQYFRLTLIISVSLFHLLTLFGCAYTKVKIYPRETPSAKTLPEKTPSEGASDEKRPTERISTVTPSSEKTYDETVSEWKSYQDVVKWMENTFSVDIKRFERRSPVPRTPEETFHLKSGVDIDVAIFLKETLNRINSSYQAQIAVVMIWPNIFNRYICSFKKDGRVFIMDYGTSYKEVTGVHGPYNSLEEYREFYVKHNPTERAVGGIVYLK